tara:strand:+ start:154 stop:858 length:705 start_codon:yes stop_codon:yes gene_type:complete
MTRSQPYMVENLFNTISPSYDKLNDLLSLGLHRSWKSKLLNTLNPRRGENWLDLCCGTGDMSLMLARRLRTSQSIIAIDTALKALQIAKERSRKEGLETFISWLQIDAIETDLPSDRFDGVVMAYGLRNLSDPYRSIKEIYRVLKNGGRCGILDFKKHEEGSIRERFQKFYLRKIVVPIASKYGFFNQYAYIEKSLLQFPSVSTQIQMALDIGFKEATYSTVCFGQMAILNLRK